MLLQMLMHVMQRMVQGVIVVMTLILRVMLMAEMTLLMPALLHCCCCNDTHRFELQLGRRLPVHNTTDHLAVYKGEGHGIHMPREKPYMFQLAAAQVLLSCSKTTVSHAAKLWHGNHGGPQGSHGDHPRTVTVVRHDKTPLLPHALSCLAT